MRATARSVGIRRTASEPEDPEPAEDRLHEMRGDAEEREHPDADRDAAEHADDVVDGGVIGPLLVPVVEPLEPEQEDPDRDREQEYEVLEPRSRPCRPTRQLRRDEQAREQRRTAIEARDIREQQRAANERAAPIPSLPDRSSVEAGRFGRPMNSLEGGNVAAQPPPVHDQALAHRVPPLGRERRRPRHSCPPLPPWTPPCAETAAPPLVCEVTRSRRKATRLRVEFRSPVLVDQFEPLTEVDRMAPVLCKTA